MDIGVFRDLLRDMSRARVVTWFEQKDRQDHATYLVGTHLGVWRRYVATTRMNIGCFRGLTRYNGRYKALRGRYKAKSSTTNLHQFTRN